MESSEENNFEEQIKRWVTNVSLETRLNKLYGDPVFNYMFDKSSTVAMVYSFSSRKFNFISSNFQRETGYDSNRFRESQLTQLIKELFEEKSSALLQKNIYPKILKCYKEYALKGTLKDLKITVTSKLKLKPEWIILQMKILEVDVSGNPASSIMFMTKISEIKSNNNLVDFVVYELDHVKKKNNVVAAVSYPLESYLYDFTPKELEIISYLKDGKTSKQIAFVLGLSAYTVNTHRKNILKKTGALNISSLVRMLIEGEMS